ncbi:MAG TPA: SpoIID/LytB domain-containing protein [Bacillota bacterium]|nr:SpoIID/LytB domain-containing protein [Bacillota bacterium]
MKVKKTILIHIIITAIVLMSFPLDAVTVYADITVPDTIRIGLSFGQAQANLFNLESETGMSIFSYGNGTYKDLLKMNAPSIIKIRRDEYYNVVNGKENEINYVRAARYEGEVIGPYHIQIGNIYADIEAARKVMNRVSSVAPSVFLAYEGGWKVWSQLYLDESECLKQIKVMQNEIGDVGYSIIYPDKKRIQVLDGITGRTILLLNSEEKIKVIPGEVPGKVSALKYKGKKYRGSMIMQSLAGSNVTLINELPLEQYLYSVVPSEMPSAWHPEALKAQAVASRNYTLATIGRHRDQGFDLCSTEHCQAYCGLEQEKESSAEAVNSTKGKVLICNGSIISAFYHSSSGGHTEDSENVWGTIIDYIRGVEDKYSLGSPHDNWTLELSRADIKEKLKQANIDLGDILDIRILEVSNYGRVTKLEVKGTKEAKVFEREKIRGILGNGTLKSIWYNLKTDADVFVRGSISGKSDKGRTSNMYVVSASGKAKVIGSSGRVSIKGMNSTKAYNSIPQLYTFDGRGFGHGLGMSQYGAKGMAEAGNNYQKILEYYYKGAIVQ